MPIRLVVRGYLDGVYFVPSPMRKEKPLLKIRITGPAIRPGRIPIHLLVDICNETQKAVNRQAAALEGHRSLRPGPPTKIVSRECTLELVGIKSGSTTLNFAPVFDDQLTLPETESMRARAIDGVAAALKSIGRKRGKPQPIDAGLLVAFDSLGTVLDRGITKLQFTVPHHNGRKKNLVAELIPATRPKIKARLQEALPSLAAQLTSEASMVEGTIEITKGEGRITPTVGSPTLFSFDQNQATDVYEARNRPVKAQVDLKTHKLKDIETVGLLGGRDFFAAKTIDQLIAEQGIHPIANLEALSGAIPDEDVDEFVAEIYRTREA